MLYILYCLIYSGNMWFLNSKALLACIRTYTLILEIEILSVWISISLHIHISLLNCFREKKKLGIGRAMRRRVTERRWKICRIDVHWKIASSHLRNRMINACKAACVRTCVPGGVHPPPPPPRRKFSVKFPPRRATFLRYPSPRSRVVGPYHTEKAAVRIKESRDYSAQDICRMFSLVNVFGDL